MKNKIIVAILALISVSCSVQTNTNKDIKPTTKPSVANEDLQTPNKPVIFKSPSFDYYIGDNPDEEACEPMEETLKRKPEINYPADITVTRDGKTVYFMNFDCFDVAESDKSFKLDREKCRYWKTRPRKVINKINTMDNKLDILKINNLLPKGCGIFANFERDYNDNLYIEGNNKIIKISEKNNVAIDFFLIPPETMGDASLVGNPTLNFHGPYNLYSDNSNLYFIFYAPSRDSYNLKFQKLSLDLKYENVAKSSGQPSFFAVYKDDIYFNSTIYNFNNSKNIKDKDFSCIRINSKNELFASDRVNNCIWKIDLTNKRMEIFAGSGKSGYKDGKGEEAEFNFPNSFDIDINDNLYVADTKNHAIRKITPDGIVSTIYKEAN